LLYNKDYSKSHGNYVKAVNNKLERISK